VYRTEISDGAGRQAGGRAGRPHLIVAGAERVAQISALNPATAASTELE
jgi:hypothetical protein